MKKKKPGIKWTVKKSVFGKVTVTGIYQDGDYQIGKALEWPKLEPPPFEIGIIKLIIESVINKRLKEDGREQLPKGY